MASSSVSQESLDCDDFELNARRTRIRKARGSFPRSPEPTGFREGRDINGGDDQPGFPGTGVIPENESPTRASAVQRAKEKRNRPNHLQKGKLPKDKRKLREKRRSTGVVQMASTTESTGDSLDDDDDEEKALNEAKRNTVCNEVIDADNPQTPSEVMRRIQQFQGIQIAPQQRSGVSAQNQPTQKQPLVSPVVSRAFVSRRNKSPSDLEADLEDNQDYDSTVSQSDTNLTLIGQSGPKESESSSSAPRLALGRSYRPVAYSPSEHKSFKSFTSNSSELDSKSNPTSTSSTSSSSSSPYSVLNRYNKDSTSVVASEQKENNFNSVNSNVNSSGRREPSPQSPKSVRQQTEPVRPVSSVLAQFQDKTRQEDVTGYTGGYTRSRYRDRDPGVRGPIGQQFASYLNKDNRDEEKRRLEKELEREKDENRRLQKVLEEKDKKIADLEREVAMMNRDLDEIDDENQKLVIENRALIQAVGQLSTHV